MYNLKIYNIKKNLSGFKKKKKKKKNIESYKLLLKIGSAIYYYIFIYDLPDGLYNGIKLGFFQKHVIEAEIITEKHTEVCVFISHYFITFKCQFAFYF